MATKASAVFLLFVFALAPVAHAQSIGTTHALAPLAGPQYTPAPGQTNIGFYGTDLGYTFTHAGSLRILFGDTWADGQSTPIGLGADDSQGSISLTSFQNGDAVDAYVAAHPAPPGKPSWQTAGPPVTFRTNLFGKVAPMAVYRDGTLLVMTVFRAPNTGFSNASDAAYAIFNRLVMTECSGGLNPSCGGGLTCDRGLGSCAPFSGDNDVPCVIGSNRCLCLPVAGGGICQDRSSPMYDTTENGRVLSIALRNEVGNADPNLHEVYYSQSWSTNKFMNAMSRTVNDFSPARANGAGNDYRPADGALPTANEKVFLWGRPNYAALGAKNLNDKLYFAYVDMPHYAANGHFAWTPKYFTGLSPTGVPQFSTSQTAAVPLDLSGGAGDTKESYDIVNQMSISWLPSLNKWVMLYGGDLDQAALGVFVGPDNGLVVHDPDGAIHARFASQPWGPWTKPVQLFKAGDPNVSPPVPGSQYASNGILFHPGCTGTCVPSDPASAPSTVGRLYAANVIEPWTMSRLDGTVDIYWNVSTGNPYGVMLMKTQIRP